MSALYAFIVCLFVFLLIVDIFAVMFRLTGMTIEKSRFQVISLLTSTGFTTKESELITQHPIRRKLASSFMVISYISTLTFISLLVNMLTHSKVDFKNIITILVAVLIIVFVFKSSVIDFIESIVEYIVKKNKFWKEFNSKYLNFLTKHRGYGICEVYLSQNSDLIGVSIKECKLTQIEIKILSIDQGDEFVSFPVPEYVFSQNDKLTVYGNINNIRERFN